MEKVSFRVVDTRCCLDFFIFFLNLGGKKSIYKYVNGKHGWGWNNGLNTLNVTSTAAVAMSSLYVRYETSLFGFLGSVWRLVWLSMWTVIRQHKLCPSQLVITLLIFIALICVISWKTPKLFFIFLSRIYMFSEWTTLMYK